MSTAMETNLDTLERAELLRRPAAKLPDAAAMAQIGIAASWTFDTEDRSPASPERKRDE